ncbi:short-chain dehydrogenase [Aspergillus heteromorphus CBS 117.55]|uniref:Short-chain dehydrogenase n=1 Tax=Aspergillus heteromorphus CBS 117.55 TaxID=1448321 RepID=A0A317WU72_9EURO|nr:short-chain dehydrogenase [Aspergillus heteromorphus CBS 117.55]PWY89973.1 short-chain dehydrogenase [Aspergillus heteromorphus CBS 117.55]
MSTLLRIWPQLFPAKPTLTATTLPPQTDKVVIITGSTSGLGLELAHVLYSAGATVYLAARDEAKAQAVIHTLTTTAAATTSTPGKVHFLHLDLSDLRTIKPAVSTFLSQQSRLDLLFNNAAVASVPLINRTAQGLEPHLGTNCVGPYLLTQLLAPILTETACHPDTLTNSVRVIWSSSMLVDVMVPAQGVPPAELDSPSADVNHNYAVSKAGNWFLADRLSRQLGEKGVISITQNPGNIYTKIYDNAPRWTVWMSTPVYYTPKEGVNTMLWAGFAPEMTVQDGGRYVIPFGRWHPCPRPDLLEAMRDEEEGGKGYARVFEEWCERVTREFR